MIGRVHGDIKYAHYALAMPTIWWAHLQNSCVIWKNRRYSYPAHSLMVVEQHLL